MNKLWLNVQINYLQDITTLTVQQIISMFLKSFCFIFTAMTVRNKQRKHDSALDHWVTNHIAYLKTWGRRFSYLVVAHCTKYSIYLWRIMSFYILIKAPPYQGEAFCFCSVLSAGPPPRGRHLSSIPPWYLQNRFFNSFGVLHTRYK